MAKRMAVPGVFLALCSLSCLFFRPAKAQDGFAAARLGVAGFGLYDPPQNLNETPEPKMNFNPQQLSTVTVTENAPTITSIKTHMRTRTRTITPKPLLVTRTVTHTAGCGPLPQPTEFTYNREVTVVVGRCVDQEQAEQLLAVIEFIARVPPGSAQLSGAPIECNNQTNTTEIKIVFINEEVFLKIKESIIVQKILWKKAGVIKVIVEKYIKPQTWEVTTNTQTVTDTNYFTATTAIVTTETLTYTSAGRTYTSTGAFTETVTALIPTTSFSTYTQTYTKTATISPDQPEVYCMTGYYKSGNTCLLCAQAPNCQLGLSTCTGPGVQNARCAPQQCNSGYYNRKILGGECKACPAVENCQTGKSVCTASDDAICTAGGCNVGFYNPSTGGACKVCTQASNCFQNATTCTTATNSVCRAGGCYPGYYRTSQGQCTSCTPVSGCTSSVACTGPTDSKCYSCAQGYYLDTVTSKCVACTLPFPITSRDCLSYKCYKNYVDCVVCPAGSSRTYVPGVGMLCGVCPIVTSGGSGTGSADCPNIIIV